MNEFVEMDFVVVVAESIKQLRLITRSWGLNESDMFLSCYLMKLFQSQGLGQFVLVKSCQGRTSLKAFRKGHTRVNVYQSTINVIQDDFRYCLVIRCSELLLRESNAMFSS